MKRLCLALIVCLAFSTSADAGDAGVKQTIAYVQKLQTDGGGFRTHEPKPDAVKIVPTLRATSSAVRALKYFGGELAQKDAVVRFVESCWDAEAGAFADMPKGKPDVFTTAVGLMAIVELKMPTEKYLPGAVKYLENNARSFEEIRIAVAGLESVKRMSAKNADWIKVVKELQGADGLFGKGPGEARDTGGSVVALLRMQAKIADKDQILKLLNAGQRQNGGWGKDDSEIASDLETTYRVMRCYHMLKAKPGNVEGVRSFVAKCRNEDGGYALMPGQASSVSGSYFAAIILHWSKDK